MTRYTKEEILETVKNCITKDRQNTYGKPENNFITISEYWYVYLKRKYNIDFALTAKDVAIMMMLLKAARMGSSPNYIDNYVDAAGYAAIAGSMCEKENK